MKHVTIPLDRRSTRDLIIGAMALILLFYAGYIFWRHAVDTVAAGVTPKVNANGSIDYTLIDVESGPGGLTSKSEWAIRLPGEFQVDRSRDGEAGGMAPNAPATTQNQHLWFTVAMNDLSPIAAPGAAGSSVADTATVRLHAERAASYWPSRQAAQYESCVSSARKMEPLIQYTDANRAKARCILGNSETSDLYAITRNGNLQATLACLKTGTTCDYEVRYGDRAITGTFPAAKLNAFEDFRYRLMAFVENATVFDR